jgi:signal transduction histidine kinase/ActR/RegA family two-component response regulator
MNPSSPNIGDAAPDFRTLFEAAPGLYLVLTPELRIVAASDAYLRATMTTREGILGRGIFDVFPDNPEDPGATGVRNLRASLERVSKTGQPDTMAVQKYDVRRPESEGGAFEERYWSPVNSPVIDSQGRVAYIIHRVEDVSEFIRLKQAGREREERASALENRAVQMEAEIYMRAQQVAEANRKLSAAFEELGRLYRQIAALMERADRELRSGEIRAPLPVDYETGAPEEMLGRIEHLILGHKRLEEQLRQSQKMEAVGRLAGGVAHDFNNLLTVIGSYTAMLREDFPNAGTRELEEIEKATERAAALTHKLLTFSRQQVLQPRVVNLNTIVSGMEELLRRLIGERIQLLTILSGHLSAIRADPNQMEQVIMNLAVNARDAMPTGGRLVIETSDVRLPSQQGPLSPGAYVHLRVTDTGHGMDSQTAARIFEPFFTTKDMGKGTGLGLASVYGIVEQSGGAILVDSAPGSGATFRIYFPATREKEERRGSEQAAVRSSLRTGTILLVEDEKPLRQLIAKILTGAGYRVIEAANGEEALAFANQCLPISVLLSDVVMPGMNGPDLVFQLRLQRPSLAVLYMSGYDRERIDPQALEHNTAFLPKPFTPHTLLAKIGELAAAEPASLRKERIAD